MITDVKAVITLGADIGGEDADIATNEYVHVLRKLLERECRGPYSEIFNEFALILRIDGSVQSWGKSGIDYIRLQKKAGYATADIFMPKEIWANGDIALLREFLADGVRQALNDIIQKAMKNKIVILSDQLNSDLDRAIKLYLTTKNNVIW